MRPLRYLVCLLTATIHQSLRVIVAARRGVAYQPGGVYDDAPRAWSRAILEAAGLQPRVVCADRLEPGRSYVFVSNHNSFVDVWVLAACLPGALRFVAKRELLRVPLFGSALRAGGQITIDRHNLTDAFGAYQAAADRIRVGMSAVVFAEGTRSRDGRLQPFKKGPFVLAIAAGVPVVPVCVTGSYRVLPRGRIIAQPGPIELRIGEPIPTAGLSYSDRDRLSGRCRQAMEALAAGVDAVPAGD